MNIIVLSGKNSCGKTTTLNIVYDTLILQGASSTNKVQEGGDKNDFSDIIDWKNKKIAFYTVGDFSYAVIDVVVKYLNLNCDTLVCACNNRFVKPYKEFAKYNSTIINKTITTTSTDKQVKNNNDARTILNLI